MRVIELFGGLGRSVVAVLGVLGVDRSGALTVIPLNYVDSALGVLWSS